jgi:hypothetical protein
MNNSLFVVGEFGGNDYNAPLFGDKGMAEVRTYVPQIIDKITSSLEVPLQKVRPPSSGSPNWSRDG